MVSQQRCLTPILGAVEEPFSANFPANKWRVLIHAIFTCGLYVVSRLRVIPYMRMQVEIQLGVMQIDFVQDKCIS